MRTTSPVPITITEHPNLPGKFTHVIRQEDARRRGWRFYGDIPFGLWRTRAAARRAAKQLQARGIVVVREGVTA